MRTTANIFGGLRYYKDRPYDAQAQFDLHQSQEYFRVIWHNDVTTNENNLDDQMPRISGGYLPIDDEAKLTFTKGTSFPTPDDYRFAKIFGEDAYTFFDRFGQDSGDVFDRYYSHVAPRSIAWIGGYAYFAQSDPREIEPDEDWILLFKIQSSMTLEQPTVMWGDSGVGGFFHSARRLAPQRLFTCPVCLGQLLGPTDEGFDDYRMGQRDDFRRRLRRGATDQPRACRPDRGASPDASLTACPSTPKTRIASRSSKSGPTWPRCNSISRWRSRRRLRPA